MSKSLVKYRGNPLSKTSGTTGTTLLIGAIVIGLLYWFFFKNKRSVAGIYKNEEVWDISWNEDGLPTKVVIHRNAARS